MPITDNHIAVRTVLLRHGKTLRELAAVLAYSPQYLNHVLHGWVANPEAAMNAVWAAVRELTGEGRP